MNSRSRSRVGNATEAPKVLGENLPAVAPEAVPGTYAFACGVLVAIGVAVILLVYRAIFAW